MRKKEATVRQTETFTIERARILERCFLWYMAKMHITTPVTIIP
jgi:hypothetical protein